jgi:hypothetical protein
VSIDATQDALADAVSDGAGAYALESQSGSVIVRAMGAYGTPRAADNGSVTSFDAVTIARAAVGQIVLSTNQRIAADVTGNGQVTSFDASRVAQFAVEIIDHFDVAESAGSDWSLVRCNAYISASSQDCGPPLYSHAPLLQSQTDDFFAILYGDVTGNWAPPGALAASSESGAEGDSRGEDIQERLAAQMDATRAVTLRGRRRAAARASRTPGAGPAVLSIGAVARPLSIGESRAVRVSIASADGIEALDLALRYDPTRLAIDDVRLEGLASDWTLATHDEQGVRRIGLYGLTPLTGSGSVLVVTVRALAETAGLAPFGLEGTANEGRIPMRIVTAGRRASGARIPR